jgi:hypothetical protein
MICHVVVFKLKPEAPQAERQRWLEQMRALPDRIDFIRSFSVGTDHLRSPSAYDVALVAEFDSLDDVRSYADHPAHLPVVEFGRALTESRISVDFEV